MLGEPDTHQLDVPPVTADDFACFTELAPALSLKLRACGSDVCPRSHSVDFPADERAIGSGVAITHGIGQRLLTRPLESWVQA